MADGSETSMIPATTIDALIAHLRGDSFGYLDRFKAADALESLAQECAALTVERDALRALWVEWLDGMYDGQDLLRRVRIAVHGPLAALSQQEGAR